jgi:hypothetical protein
MFTQGANAMPVSGFIFLGAGGAHRRDGIDLSLGLQVPYGDITAG